MFAYITHAMKTKRLSATVCAAALATLGMAPASAQPVLQNQLLAKAQPDECFVSLASPQNLPLSANPCTNAGSIKKVDQAYAWGLTKIDSSSRVWFGTAANVECLVLQLYLGLNTPMQTPSYACEFSQSQFAKNYFAALGQPVPANFPGDWRPPKLYYYDYSAAGQLVDVGVTMDAASQKLLASTLGIRSAGSALAPVSFGEASAANGVIFFAGPALSGKAINLFAFKDTGQFIASTQMPVYNDIRQWIVANNALYTGVRDTASGAGVILKWIGDATPANVFKFAPVGQTDAEVAYFTATTGPNARLYVTTWGGINVLGIGQSSSSSPKRTAADGADTQLPMSGVWVSPVLPANGALPDSTAPWTKIWDVSKYEVDPNVAVTLFGGAIGTLNNQVYWGLMQVPFTGVEVLMKSCPGALQSSTDALQAIAYTTRPIPIFRADGTGAAPPASSSLLYGSANLYKSTCVNGNPTSAAGNTLQWAQVPNASGQTPLYGAAGFGNPFNTYTWSAATYKQKLYFGTFDWSYIAMDGLPNIAQALGVTLPSNAQLLLLQYMGIAAPYYGADVWRFDNTTSKAVAESQDGLGNFLNYGVRTLYGGSDYLFAGTANPMNLKTVDTSQFTPLGGMKGGWEVRRLTGSSSTIWTPQPLIGQAPQAAKAAR
ncbi:MAG: hypothetical protein U1E30_10705 [Rhodoblastus sp.]